MIGVPLDINCGLGDICDKEAELRVDSNIIGLGQRHNLRRVTVSILGENANGHGLNKADTNGDVPEVVNDINVDKTSRGFHAICSII